MGQGIDMTVNRLPARTWNWLKMNESRLTDVKIEKACPVTPVVTGHGTTWERVSAEKIQSEQAENGFAWKNLVTGMGPDMDRLAEEDEQAQVDVITAETGADEDNMAVFDYECQPGERYFNRLYLHAKENSVLNVTVLYRSAGAGEGLAAHQIKVRAEKNAVVRIYMAEILDVGVTCLSDLGGVCEDNARVELVKLELGAGKLYSGGEIDLKGKASNFTAGIGYTAKPGQHLDMNYTARHHGKKTESLMEVSGVVSENAFKIFRGTIDFIAGCAGSKGTESEDVLLLGEELVNQTIPLILCAEEDVEGNHGASIGKLDDQTLFYLASRGIPKEEAERMLARARVDALNARIPVKSVRDAVEAYLGGGDEADEEEEEK